MNLTALAYKRITRGNIAGLNVCIKLCIDLVGVVGLDNVTYMCLPLSSHVENSVFFPSLSSREGPRTTPSDTWWQNSQGWRCLVEPDVEWMKWMDQWRFSCSLCQMPTLMSSWKFWQWRWRLLHFFSLAASSAHFGKCLFYDGADIVNGRRCKRSTTQSALQIKTFSTTTGGGWKKTTTLLSTGNQRTTE